MKKVILTLAALAASFTIASAQDAFKHLSIGANVSLTGLGVDLSLPIVTDHVVLTAGYNFILGSGYNAKTTIEPNELNNTIVKANGELAGIGATERISTTFSSIDVTAAMKSTQNTAKILFEIYPSAKHSFHFTAGILIDSTPTLIGADVTVSDSFYSQYASLKSEVDALNAKYTGTAGYMPTTLPDGVKYNVDQKTYKFSATDKTATRFTVDNSGTVHPYLGIGWGRSIPDSHLGFQFDMGVYYQGKPSLTGSTETTYDASAQKVLEVDPYLGYLVVAPQLTFRLVYKIF